MILREQIMDEVLEFPAAGIYQQARRSDPL